MIVRNKETIETLVRADGVQMTEFFGTACQAGEKVTMGYAVFPPGTIVPAAAHTGDEYSFILSGKVVCKSNGTEQEASAGMATFIPAGETHESFNCSEEDATLVWMLVEK